MYARFEKGNTGAYGMLQCEILEHNLSFMGEKMYALFEKWSTDSFSKKNIQMFLLRR